MKNKIANVGESAWIFGLIFCSLGVCLTAKCNLGVATIVAPGYVLYLKISEYAQWFTLGMSQYLVQGIVIVLLTIFTHRFKLKYIICLFTAVLHGIFVDVWNVLLKFVTCPTLIEKIICFAVGMLVTSLAVALMLRTYLPQEVHEMAVKEFALTVKASVNKVKWIYDIFFLALAIILMLCLFGTFSFEMIGTGTVAMALLNTPLITLWGKMLDKFFSFTPISSKFYNTFEKIMD